MRRILWMALAVALPAAGQYNIATFAGGGPNNVLATIVPIGDVTGVAVDNNNRYFSSLTMNRVFRYEIATGKIYVVAGYGVAGSSGDGGAAKDAALNGPRGLAVSAVTGCLYVADSGNHTIRCINLNTGVISTVAGTPGTPGSTGDNSSATSARLNGPKGVALDSLGSLYIADTNNNRVRVVNSSGIISNFAGTGNAGFAGDGLTATSAQLNTPSGIAVDASNNVLYIADEMNHRIRRVTIGSGNVITTVVNQSLGTAGFSGDGNSALNAQIFRPQGVAVDPSGNFFVADTYNQRIRRVAVSGGNIGNISTAAGNGGIGAPLGDGGPASSAHLNFPAALAVDSSLNLIIPDYLDDRLRIVPSPYGGGATINTIAGNGNPPGTYFGDNGPASDAVLNQAWAVSVDAAGTFVLIADTYNQLVRKVSLQTGIMTTVAGNGVQGFSGDGAAATSAQMNDPTGVVLDSAGNFFIADYFNNKIRKVSSSGNISTYAGANIAGGYAGDNGPAANALLNQPISLAIDGNNNLFIADRSNHCIRRIAADTQIITTVAGNCTVAGFGGDGLSATGVNARLNFPQGVAVNSTGTVIYIADTNNHRVRWVSNSLINTFAGTGNGGYGGDGGPANGAQLNLPTGVTLDIQGNLFIADFSNERVRRVPGGNPNNTITTVAGNGNRGFGGDNGSATSAQLADPVAIGADQTTGRVYVGDKGNLRVRVLFAPCSYTLVPTSNLNIPAAGGNFNVQVNTGAGCTWAASVPGGLGWVQIISGQSGTGTGTVTYSITGNPGGQRSGTLTIAGTPFNIMQLAGNLSDFNNDGHLDVVWQDPATGQAQVFFLGGVNGTTFTGAAVLSTGNSWRIAAVGDFNQDGHPDIVWQDPVTGQSQIWFLGGVQGTSVIDAAVLTNSNTWRIMAAADFNRDGHLDLIWEDPVSGTAQIWFLGGPKGATIIGAANLTATNTWKIVGAGDFNADGQPDVLWQDQSTGATQVWYLGGAQGNIIIGAANLVLSNSFRIVSVGDFNLDGFPDVVWQDPNSGNSQVWFLNNLTITGAAPLSGANSWRIVGPR